MTGDGVRVRLSQNRKTWGGEMCYSVRFENSYKQTSTMSKTLSMGTGEGRCTGIAETKSDLSIISKRASLLPGTAM